MHAILGHLTAHWHWYALATLLLVEAWLGRTPHTEAGSTLELLVRLARRILLLVLRRSPAPLVRDVVDARAAPCRRVQPMAGGDPGGRRARGPGARGARLAGGIDPIGEAGRARLAAVVDCLGAAVAVEAGPLLSGALAIVLQGQQREVARWEALLVPFVRAVEGSTRACLKPPQPAVAVRLQLNPPAVVVERAGAAP